MKTFDIGTRAAAISRSSLAVAISLLALNGCGSTAPTYNSGVTLPGGGSVSLPGGGSSGGGESGGGSSGGGS
ncbi:MAG TPA: hypothetical protein PKH39_20140, partial [Woeseiaceae bacterium]|nr:hypothetical protein [Woeseiaceae bacterium]